MARHLGIIRLLLITTLNSRAGMLLSLVKPHSGQTDGHDDARG